MQIKANSFTVTVRLYEDQPISGSWAKVLHKSGGFFVSRSLEWWDKSEWETLAGIYDPNRNPIVLYCGTEKKESLVGVESIQIGEDSVKVEVKLLTACNMPRFFCAKTNKEIRQLEEQEKILLTGASQENWFNNTHITIIGAFRSILDQSGDIVFSDIPEDSHALSSEFGGHEWYWMKEWRAKVNHLLNNAELIDEPGKAPWVRLDDGESSNINEDGTVEFTFSNKLGVIPKEEWIKFKIIPTGEEQEWGDDTTCQPCRLVRVK